MMPNSPFMPKPLRGAAWFRCLAAHAEERKLLILDLDEALIFASETPLDRESDHEVGRYSVYRRPFLSEFLAHVAARFEVAVWTASTAAYADEICAAIFDYSPSFVWARDRCTLTRNLESDSWEHLKNLAKVKRLGYSLRQVIAVDDTPDKYAKTYGNLVRVSPYFGDMADEELPYLAAYLDQLAGEESVRTIEKRGWRERVVHPAFPANPPSSGSREPNPLCGSP